MSAQVEAHEAAAIFPLMDGIELAALVDDIRAHGLQEPIVLFEGRVLDGRNRLRACELADVQPLFVEWVQNGSSSPTEWVVSHNLHRRHLTPGQKAVLALDMLPRLEDEARERQRIAGETFGEAHPKDEVSPLSDEALGRSDEKAAAIVGVGRSTVADVKAIAKRDPAALDDLRSGDKTVAQVKRKVGLHTSCVPVKDGAPKIYFGKGDKWQEAAAPLKRYLDAWEKRQYRFGHINYREAGKRLRLIDELIEKLTAAREDLETRSLKARPFSPPR